MNPLNYINKYFPVEFWNPNPKMSALKSGDRYTIAFEVDKDTFDLFCGAPNATRAGMILEGALKVTHNHGAIGTCDDDGEIITDDQAPDSAPEPRSSNGLAQHLYRSGYFNNPRLWAALIESGVYTSKMHYEFIRSCSCLCCSPAKNKQFHSLMGYSDQIACNGDVVWHHIRTAENSGTGIKPHDFITVPVCDAHHRVAHSYQTSHLNEWLLSVAAEYRANGIKSAIKRHIGLGSLSELDQAQLNAFHHFIRFAG